MIVTGIDPGPDGTFADWSEVAEAYEPRGDQRWRQLAGAAEDGELLQA